MITARSFFSRELCFQITSEGPQLRIRCLFPFVFSFGICCPHLEVTCAQLRVLPSCFGTGAGGGRGAPCAQVVLPLLQAAAPGVHEEVADGRELQAQLLRNGDLHLFRWALVLLEDGKERSALQVSEHQARFLLGIIPVFVWFLLFAFARCQA